MVLETWATDFPIGDHQQMFITQDNPVQRRPKIDYFSSEAVQNMIPIVSHISSNGYYGYCAMPTTTPTMATDNDVVDQPTVNDENVQMDIQMDIQMILQTPNDNDKVNQTLAGSDGRRKRCQKLMHNDQVIAMKRCRNQAIDAEIGEGLSLHYLCAYITIYTSTYNEMRRNDRDTKFIEMHLFSLFFVSRFE